MELHPEKTRLIEFGRQAAARREGSGKGRPWTFNFLGFTHICGRTRKGGFPVVRHTMRRRMAVKLTEVYTELRRRHNASIPETGGGHLRSVVQGRINFLGVPLNFHAIDSFRWKVGLLWRKALGRRSQRAQAPW